MPETPKHEKGVAKVTPDATSGDAPNSDATTDATIDAEPTFANNTSERPPEFGGQKGLEPTRYGDWEKNGRCTDF